MTGDAFQIDGFGVDDVTLGFDMTGSPSLARLNEAAGVETRWGKRLGERTSWGAWANTFGRSTAHWKGDTRRLYVQAKLTDDERLCGPGEFQLACRAVVERMAAVGVVSYEPIWVTRIDVAVDARCEPASGKLLLDALEAARLPNGWRTTAAGEPRSTVYFKARASEKVKARAYCRNLKRKRGEAFGLIRLEAQERFAPLARPLDGVDRSFLVTIWESRFLGLTGRVHRLEREAQTVEIARRVAADEFSPAQGERLAMLLDLERLGIARSYYPPAMYADRRRLARRAGLSRAEVRIASASVDLGSLLAPYRAALMDAA